MVLEKVARPLGGRATAVPTATILLAIVLFCVFLLGWIYPQQIEAQFFRRPDTATLQGPIPVLQPPPVSFVYPQHETLTYSVDWRVFTTGMAVFHLDRVGDVLKISATADTIGAVNLLFPVVDGFQSGFNVKTGCSTGFDKQTQEGRRKIASDMSFDYANGKQTVNERNLVKGTEKVLVTHIPGCLTDSLSAMFYAQSHSMTPGQTFYFPLADATRPVTVGMKVEDREEVKTPAGIFETIRLQPTAAEGVVKNRGRIWIWYSDDDRHLPVQIQASLFWGTITFHLQSVDLK
ncbi:MAG: DUF3108 domain-containing protein [Acidobacteriaceae bacterium]